MGFGFLFWLFFVGIIVASLQDLKRREVDNWLNLFLLVASFIFIFYRSIFEKDVTIIFQTGFALIILFIVMNLFYYGRVFAGGDAKLLVAMTALFVGATFDMTLINIGIFLLFLMLSGSIYGLVYSFVLYLRDRKKVNREMKKGVSNSKVKLGVFIGIGIAVLGFILRIFVPRNGNLVFMIGILILLFPLLFVFSKALEKISMIKILSGKELREGDWLVDDIKIKGKVIKADWEGLNQENIKLLRGKRRVKIKEGLPFVPAFLIAFLFYSFARNWLLELLGFLI